MRFREIETKIRNEILNSHRAIKDKAPQNSEYRSNYRGEMFNFILVNNNPVYTNTNNLYNSVDLKYEGLGFNKNITAITYVDGGRVPYYARAVLSPTLETVIIRGARDYGEEALSYGGTKKIDYIENRNYLYYMKAKEEVHSRIKSFDGMKFHIKDRLEDFKW